MANRGACRSVIYQEWVFVGQDGNPGEIQRKGSPAGSLLAGITESDCRSPTIVPTVSEVEAQRSAVTLETVCSHDGSNSTSQLRFSSGTDEE